MTIGDDVACSNPPLRGVWPRLVLAVLLVAGGSAAWRLGDAEGDGAARVVGLNRPVDPGATDPLDASAHNSPTVRVNPKDPAHIAVADRIDRPEASCALHVSFDGGSTWSPTAIPPLEGRSVACFSPDLAFGADGSLYLAFTSFGPAAQATASAGPDTLWLARSNDGGRSLTPPVQVAGPSAFQVRLAADPERPERLYVAWLQGSQVAGFGFGGDGNPIVVSRSDDYGSSWAPPAAVSSPARRRVVAPSLAVEPGGRLLVAYLDVGDDRLDYNGEHRGRGGAPYEGRWSLLLARSDDGQRWAESTVDDGVVPIARFLVLYPPGPSLAVDRARKRVYVGFHDGRLGDADVMVWTSKDAGVRWGKPRRVNDTRPHDRRSQYLPRLATTPGGRLDVLYYDRRADEQDVLTSVSFQSSFDGGATFDRHVGLTRRPFDSRVGSGSDRDMPDLGDRLGLVVTDAGALAIWADTRGGTRESGKQDLASTLLTVTPPSRVRPAVRLGGLGAGLAGAGAAVSAAASVLRRRRRDRRKRPQ